MSRACPNCASVLRRQGFHGVTLDTCPACGGIWFDPDELRELLRRDIASLGELGNRPTLAVQHAPGAPSMLLCPDDRVRLQEYHYMYSSPAVLETCPVCGGFYVAPGELAKIQQAYLRAHAPTTEREQAGIDLGAIAADSEREVLKHDAAEDLFAALRHNTSGWIGLL